MRRMQAAACGYRQPDRARSGDVRSEVSTVPRTTPRIDSSCRGCVGGGVVTAADCGRWSSAVAACAVFATVATWIGGAVAFGASLQDAVLEISVRGSGITLHAREAPLTEVLAAVGRQTGVKMVLQGDLSARITETFVGVPIDEALRRLARGRSVVLIYGGASVASSDAPLVEVWMTASATDRPAAAVVERHEGNEAGRRQQTSPPRDPMLTIALRSGPSDTKTQLIDELVRERGAYAAVGILREAAVHDPDPRVRRGAARALASLTTPDALDAIRATLRDPHPGVRYEGELALRRLTHALSTNASGE